MLAALLGTHPFIRWLTKRNYGQFIRQDGPTAHYTKRGTPTMGGVVIILADRKSTRLNSSHVASSYAVFCLTKKMCVSLWCIRPLVSRLFRSGTRSVDDSCTN